ncbi:hypothetical protein Daus18300_005731 [Diaporthe australafricana]|uniref:Uncharacterized protein n=1 Tax=Diaporthe australafricana TaxID=127596 RepID=A0ABR3WZG1_9PEZI
MVVIRHFAALHQWFLAIMPRFFHDDNGQIMTSELGAAENTFREALERGAVSHLEAFKEAIRSSAHARAMDALWATSGGIDAYIRDVPSVDLRHPSDHDLNNHCSKSMCYHYLPFAVRSEINKNISRRKVQEIRKMMGLGQKQPQEDQAVQPHNPEVQETDGITDGMSQLCVDGSAMCRMQ